MPISLMTFIAALANGGLFLASLGISIFTAIVFRQISKLPPDMNPLAHDSDADSNLTARPHKRNKSELIEKHLSTATVDSRDPLIGAPRMIPFSHTRGDSQGTLTSNGGHTFDHASRGEPEASGTGSWQDHSYTYRSPSPGSERSKSPSSLYSRTTTGTSTTTAFKDWMSSSARASARGSRDPSPTKTRGEYASLTTTQECIDENDDFGREAESRDNTTWSGGHGDTEEDLGSQRLLGTYGERKNDRSARPAMGPLGMNPPTPQKQSPGDGRPNSMMASELPRAALADVHNFSVSNRMSMPPLVKDLTLKEKGYEQLRNRLDIHVPLAADSTDGSDSIRIGKRRTPSAKRRAAKRSIFGSVDEGSDDEDLDDGDNAILVPSDRDRKGRVVSNSGADLGGNGSGLSSSAYGDHIAGTGKGRRRDVSGKMAEEGRNIADNNSSYYYEKDSTGFGLRQPSRSIRAPGWSRFAGY